VKIFSKFRGLICNTYKIITEKPVPHTIKQQQKRDFAFIGNITSRQNVVCGPTTATASKRLANT
jgi:hypothetical protein